MNTQMVVTNLRIPKQDWLEAKTMAEELGISANSFVQKSLMFVTSRADIATSLTGNLSLPRKSARDSFYDLLKLANLKNKPLSLSSDDKLIYE